MSFTNTNLFKLIFIGRPVPEKGLNELLMALALLPEYNWTLTVVGQVSKLNVGNALTDSLPAKQLFYVGAVDNSLVCGLLNEHDIVIIPSHYENFGNIALEAMACGKAIIASRTGGLKEIIKDNYNGIQCSPKDYVDLSLKLKLIFDRPELIAFLGNNALNEVQLYSWPTILKMTTTLFKSLE